MFFFYTITGGQYQIWQIVPLKESVHQSPVMTEHGFGEFCPHVTEQKCEQNVHRLY